MRLLRILIATSLVSLAAAAQVAGASASRPPDALDGGVTASPQEIADVPKARPAASTRPRPDRVGVMRAVSDDAGTPEASAPAAPPPAREQELARLRLRVQALEARVAASQDQAEQLQGLNDQLAALRQQMADAEAQRAAAQTEAAVRVEGQQQALDALSQAQALLAGGNSADLGEALAAAQGALTGQARDDVAQARAALARDDLYNARLLLAAAVAHAQVK